MTHVREINSQDPSPLSQIRCCNATTLKISLLVLGLLFISGAIAAHLYQVNAMAVYTMGGTGGLLILGVVIASIIQYVQNRHFDTEERGDQDFQARMLGLNVSQLPQSTSERRQVIEEKRQETLKQCVQQQTKALDMQIEPMRQSIEKFRKIIEDPNEPLEVVAMYGLIQGIYDGTHQAKINYFWSNVKLMGSWQNLGNSVLSLVGLNQNEEIIQKQQEITQLRNQLLQLRRESYHGFIQSLEREKLLKEAQEYYLKSFFSQEEHAAIKDSIEQMTIETILPKLKERVLTQAENAYDIVEMQEIISQIGNRPLT